jgi:hypothetical protein
MDPELHKPMGLNTKQSEHMVSSYFQNTKEPKSESSSIL